METKSALVTKNTSVLFKDFAQTEIVINFGTMQGAKSGEENLLERE